MNYRKLVGVFGFIIIYMLLTFGVHLSNQWVPNYMIPVISTTFYIITIFMVIFVVRIIQKKGLESIGIRFNSIVYKILVGVIISLCLCAIFLLIVPKIEGYGIKDLLPLKPKSIIGILWRCFFYIFFVGIAEELVFRGFILSSFIEALDSEVLAIILSSVIFGLWHYFVNQSILQVINTTIIGLILSTIRLKTKDKNIISVIIGHGVYDSLFYIIAFII